MSYNESVSGILNQLGITAGRLPVDGMTARVVDYVNRWKGLYARVEVWVAPLPPMPEGRRWKRSTHRLLCKCPVCGATLSAGRLHQHLATAACYTRAARMNPRTAV